MIHQEKMQHQILQILVYFNRMKMTSRRIIDNINHSPKIILLVIIILCFGLYTHLSAVELRTYYISCDPEEFNYIISNPLEDHYIDCVFEYNTRTWRDVRIRIRGESSRYFRKKSFKVDFSSEDRFYGRDKLNLVSEYRDPSFSREFLSFDLYHRAGLFASQRWFAKLIVNGEYRGLYLDVENVDEFYLKRVDLNDNSSIYKADLNGTCLTLSENVEELWEKKTNSKTGFYDLNNLIEWIGLVGDEDFYNELQKRFNPDDLARTIAVNTLCGNSSTYYHNYYLIHDIDQDGIWRMLPWDMDNTWIYGNNGRAPDYFRSGHQVKNKINALLRRCWRDNEFREVVFKHLNGMIDSIFTEDYYTAKTDTIETLILNAIEEDPDFQFSVDDFTSEIRTIPGLARQRGEAILNSIEKCPYPFDLHPARIVPEGIVLSWEPTEYADGHINRYRVQISDTSTFWPERIEYFVDQPYSLYSELEPGDYFWRVRAYSPWDLSIQSISFFLPINIPEGVNGGTEVSDRIETSTVWTTEGNPYKVLSDITVLEGATLTIESGVIVTVSENSSLIIKGGLQIEGTKNDSVMFYPSGVSENWGGIIIDNSIAPVLISYANFENANGNPTELSTGGAIQIDSCIMTIEDCSFRNGSSGGISGNNSVISIHRTHFSGFQQNTIEISGGSFDMQNCQISSSKSGEVEDLVSFEKTTEVQIHYSNFYGGDDIIDLDSVEYASITCNVIKEAEDKGITIGHASKNINLENNIVTNCDIGVAIHEDSEVKLYNNVIAFNKTGLKIDNSGDGNATSIRNTVIWRNNNEIQFDEPANIDVAYCMVKGTFPFPGQNNYFENPHFIDQWNNNFRLRDDSPLIDAGWGTDCPHGDIEMMSRFDVEDVDNNGSGEINYVDIGVYEFGSESPYEPDDQVLPDKFELISVYPNPFNNSAFISFEVRQSEEVEISIFDILGRRLLTHNAIPIITGRYTYSLNSVDLGISSGLYLIRIKQSEKYNTRRIVFIK